MISLKQKLAHYSWEIAYGVFSERIITNGLQGIELHVVNNPYKNKWFADPFILEEDIDYIHFLVEEFDYAVGRGRIARIKVRKKDNKIIECSIILDIPTHLSFPAIYQIDDEVYVHPENSASRASYMYRYDRKSDKLVEPIMVVDEPIVDAIIRKDNYVYRMYATRVPDPNGCVLHEYVAKSFFGPYKHVSEDIFINNSARMAGNFMVLTNGQIVRPAQDCLRGYGNAVIMYVGHQQICRVASNSYKYAGIHTFNVYNGSFVIDYKKYDYPILYKLTRILK